MKEITVNARDFVAAGGQLSLAEWATLDPDEQAACIEASRERMREDAAAIVYALVVEVRDAMDAYQLSALAERAEKAVSP